MRSSTLIPKPNHFDYHKCLQVLGDNDFECLHFKENGTIVKALSKGGHPFAFRISEENEGLKLDLLNGRSNYLAVAIFYVREWFDMDRDLKPFYGLLNENPKLSFLLEHFEGLRLMGIPDLFEALCWSILGQQINLSFAAKLKRRLVENYGERLEVEGKIHYLFPRPEALAPLDPEALRPLQISQRKAEYLIGISRLFLEGKISKQHLEGIGDAEAVQETLLKIRGIGLWTANYVMMKSLLLPNAIPYGDSGLNSALYRLELTNKRPTKEEVDAIFEPFDGWKSYLTRYLWRSLSLNT